MLDGMRIGVTASRMAAEQVAMFERRGAETVWAPVLQLASAQGDDEALRLATESVLAEPVDLLVATTGIGMKAWLEAAADWGLQEKLLAHLDAAQIIARAPRAVGAVRPHGLQDLWSPSSECFGDVAAHLRDREVDGLRVVVQEHGHSLSPVARSLELRGARVEVVAVYRMEPVRDLGSVLRLVDLVADREMDAVTFTAAPAVTAFLEAARVHGRCEEVLAAFADGVVAVSVGPVTAAALEGRGVATIWPDRSRLAAMVNMVARELPERRAGVTIDVAGGHLLRLQDDRVLVDGTEVLLTPAPLAVLRALCVNPGDVVSRGELLGVLPTGTAEWEHAVEMAVARLRQGVGPRVVQTMVSRGYRLAVG